MGWQPAPESRPGNPPGRDGELPHEFTHDGAWASAPPSAALAAALVAAAGPDGLYEGCGTDAQVGITRQWAAIESWAGANKLGSLRSMTREDADGAPRLRRRPDLPEGWDDSLNYEVAAALAMGPVSAGNLATLAWALGTRLPEIGRLLADGTLTMPKAKLVVQILEPLDEAEAARAEALVLPELAGKTYFQMERLAWRAAVAVAPDVAERRRSAAERQRARVTLFREEAGTVGLSGRDLPAAEALSGHANVLARAAQYADSGAFPGRSGGALQALAYLDLLNGVAAAERLAFARGAVTGPQDGPGPDDGQPDDPGQEGPGPEGPGRGDRGPGGPGGPGPDASAPSPGAAEGDAAEPGASPGPDDASPGAPARPALPEIAVPLVTLTGQAERPGDNRLLGALDPPLARALAEAAARTPASRWEVTIVDDHGYAIGHGIARDRRRRGKPPPAGSSAAALPARINITVTEAQLRHLAAQPRPGAPPGGWHLAPTAPVTPSTLTSDGRGSWALALTLPGGRDLTVRFDVVPTLDCDHRHQTTAYQPTARLRRLVQVRDHECTFPTCSRPARESDFEHAVPFDQGGPTDACNAGARSRRCHQVKQLPGWTVTQPKPGWHAWTTPTGRTYVQAPWRYPV
jgi:hypothetical protein